MTVEYCCVGMENGVEIGGLLMIVGWQWKVGRFGV